MAQVNVAAWAEDEDKLLPEFPDIELPEDDGRPLETYWHRLEMNLLCEVVQHRWRDRQDFVVGGNMFIYFSLEQARTKYYRGPDFFLVKGVDGSYMRKKWVVWLEGGRYPDVIIELMSPSTKHIDLGLKKELYEQTFHTREYFAYCPDEDRLWGWRLTEGRYVEIEPNARGWLWSEELDAWLGPWEGQYLLPGHFIRLFDREGRLILRESEEQKLRAEAEQRRAEAEQRRAEAEQRRADEEQRRADEERRRADAAEAELARLKAELERMQQK